MMKLFFLVATVTMKTEKLSFSYFHCNHCYENKTLHENNVAYRSKLSLKKWSQKDEESSRKPAIKIYPLPHCNDADCSNRVETHHSYLFIYLFIYFAFLLAFFIYMSGFCLFLKIRYFF